MFTCYFDKLALSTVFAANSVRLSNFAAHF
jgi:hypothetical protein